MSAKEMLDFVEKAYNEGNMSVWEYEKFKEEFKEPTAREMFEKLGLEYQECKYHGEVEEISYVNEYNYSTKVRFELKNKRFIAYYGEDSAGNIDMELLQAINKQIEELGW